MWVAVEGSEVVMRLECFGAIAFAVTLIGFLPIALQLTDPLTHRSIDQKYGSGHFPVVVVSGDQAWVDKLEDPHNIPPPPPGASYFVPIEREQSIREYLRDHEKVQPGVGWVLRVKELSPDRQKIELFLMGDGYSGGVYEATATTITPLYRKSTGPGFAFIFGLLALVLNYATWALGSGIIRWLRRGRNGGEASGAVA